MELIWIILYTTLAYLIGSIPSAYWLGKLYFGIDLRDHGLGNNSHLNADHILGRKPSMVIRALDMIKGATAAALMIPLSKQISWISPEEAYILTLSLGLAAILGHIFSIFTHFKGGRGYHVALGVLLIVQPAISFVFLGVTLLSYSVIRVYSISYIMGAISIPVFILLTKTVWYDRFLPMMIFGTGIFLVLIVTHYASVVENSREMSWQVRLPNRIFRK